MRLGLAIVLVVGCARAVPLQERPDAGLPSADAPVDPAPDAPSGGGGRGAAALILTEIALAPSAGEFVEIANPTSQAIDLSTYYLSDSGKYFQLPAGAVAVDTNDFIARFPAGATIQARGVITVAIDSAANFRTTYGAPPTFSVADGTMTPVAANGVATLTNSGEVIVLFQWDGQSDVVADSDMMIAGVPTAANTMLDKSGAALDGPDSDTATTAYAADEGTIGAQPTAPASGASTKRIAREAGHETQGGAGNGIAGDDETSENTAVTWDTTFAAPSPGTVPTVLLP